MEDLKTELHSECKMIEANSSECTKNDAPLLTDEKFDFDLSLSPISENEDEVFIGPIGHKEKCIAVSLESHEGPTDKTSPSHLDEATWSPLAGEKFVEIFKEAHLVALQLQSASKTKRNNTGQQEELKTEAVEKFVQESKSKLKILERGIVMDKTPKSIKRETYCVGESPISQLPPSFQKCSQYPVRLTEDSHCPQRLLNASSPGQLDKLSKASIMHLSPSRGDKNIKKLSAFQNAKKPSASESNNLAVGQPKQGKLSSSSSRNNQNSMGSSEDLLSDKSSITSDGDLSFCNSSSAQENQTLPTPSKLMVKTRQLKPSGNIHMRRITSSSSSSSVSSMNSSFNSISLSPKKGKVQTSGVVSKSFANRPSLSIAPSKISVVRPLKMALVQTTHIDTSGNPQRATSATKGNPSVSASKCKGAVTCESSGSGIQKGASDPNQTLIRKNMLGNIRASSSPKLKTKTVTSVAKPEMSSKNIAARALQPVKLLSCGSIGSNVVVTPPLKTSEEGLKSCSAAKFGLRTPASNRRHSSLPTPAGRRVSGIPTLTPKTIPKSVSSPTQVSSVSSKKTLATSSKWTNDSKTRVTISSSSSTEGDSSPIQIVPIALDFSPEKSSEEMEQSVTKIEEPAKESLLIDIGLDKTPIGVDKIVIQRCENKPLIDLFNTPEIIKAAPVKPTGQLIDLSSPLIQLGPEGNKENVDSPLLKF